MSESTDITIVNVVQWTINLAQILATLAVGTTIYLFFQKGSLNVARWKTVTELEAEIIRLHTAKFVIDIPTDSGERTTYDEHELRFVLDNRPAWSYVEDTKTVPRAGYFAPISIEIKGSRYWYIRDINSTDGYKVKQYLNSQAFHESILWFRKANRAIADGILLRKELAAWWRQIVFMGSSGRLAYMKQYFQGYHDIESMAHIIAIVICELQATNHKAAVAYCRQYFTKQDLDVLILAGEDGVKAFKVLHDNSLEPTN